MVLQGDVMAPLIASVYVNDLIKDFLAMTGNALYMYKSRVPIPCMGLMDDLQFFVKVGVASTKENAFLNVSSGGKGLHFSDTNVQTWYN